MSTSFEQIASFEPISGENPKVLILGTMPGKKSLEVKQYYANKQNQFWRIIYGLFNDVVEEDYEKRKAFLKIHHIAVWDVLKSCEREGSSDSRIIRPVPNDFETFFMNYPGIKAVFFNGKKAGELFNKLVKKEMKHKKHYKI